MAAATAARGLSAADLDSIRTTLQSGRKPRVLFTASAGQIAGQTGQVVALNNPADDEWVVVRFGHDELPFSPTDLAIPPRASAKRAGGTRARKRAPARATAAEPAKVTERLPAPATAPRAAHVEPVAAGPASTIPPQRQEDPMTSTQESTVDSAAPAAKPARKTTPRVPKVKPPAALTITLAYTEGEWTVGAQQGAKALAKPYLIKAAEALKMVAMLDVPGVHEAVEQIIAAERAETMAHADRLRAELAEIEARLADLSAPH